MNLLRTIKKILSEEHKFLEVILDQISKIGLYPTLKITGLSYTKLFSMGIGPEYFTRKIKQEFIQDFFKSLGYGVSLIEFNTEPIYYNSNEKEYREISYLGINKVAVTVWDRETNDIEGEFGVLYHNLNDDMIDSIFDIVISLYENNDIITEDTSKKDKIKNIIHNQGLFDFLIYSGLNPFQLSKMINLNILPKDVKYQFLDDVSEHLISQWISDYTDSEKLSSLMYTNKDGRRNIEIQYFGGGGITGEKFGNDGKYFGLINLEYSELPEHIFNNLFDIVLYEIYYKTIFKESENI